MTWTTESTLDLSTMMNNPDQILNFITNMAITYGPKIIGAILVVWIGFKIVNFIDKLISKVIRKSKVDPMVESFLISIVSVLLKTLVLISAAGMIWVQTSSFVALIAAAWLAVGMALSWTLWNFASGIMILIFKPYKIWDYIEAAGHAWSVKEIHIFNTMLLTVDKKLIIVPNSEITASSLVNYSTEPLRRVDLDIGISYSDDIDLAKKTLHEIVVEEDRVVERDAITIAVKELGDNAVIITCRVFVKGANYWAVKFDMLENIKKTFDKVWLNFPFPQRDVHMYNEK